MHLPVPRDSRVLASPPPAPDFVHPLHLTSAHLKLVYLTFVHLKSGYLTFVHRDLSVTFVQLDLYPESTLVCHTTGRMSRSIAPLDEYSAPGVTYHVPTRP